MHNTTLHQAQERLLKITIRKKKLPYNDRSGIAETVLILVIAYLLCSYLYFLLLQALVLLLHMSVVLTSSTGLAGTMWPLEEYYFLC